MACAVTAVFAWDVEHDEIARLTGEALPAEIRAFFSFEDFGVLTGNCHFPDMTESEPRRWRTVDDMARWVDAEDRAILEKAGCRGYWLHTEEGKAVVLTLLSRAFATGAHTKAAFYLSLLTHSVSDESALNHPTLGNYHRYTKFAGVQYPSRKIEPGAKNVFGFRSDGPVAEKARERLAKRRPFRGADASFEDALLRFAVEAVRQGAYSAEKEGAVFFAPLPEATEALADLVAMQVDAILDMAETAWRFRRADQPLPPPDFKQRSTKAAQKFVRTLDPFRESVWAGLADARLDPPAPKGVVGVVCEPYGVRGDSYMTYAGKVIAAAAARTLRDNGYAIKALSFWQVDKKMLPSPAAMPILLLVRGSWSLPEGVVRAVRAYLAAGGRLVLVGGSDPENLTGFSGAFVKRGDMEVPASGRWAGANAGDWRKMSVYFDGKVYPQRQDANVDGYCKPRCLLSIDAKAPGVEPFAEFSAGGARFAVAARKGNVAWVPQYLLMPFLYTDETTADWAAQRLDVFGTRVLLKVIAGDVRAHDFAGVRHLGVTAGAATTWSALDASDQLLYKTIHAPRVVAEQPAHTHKEMVVMPDGEIRYYGRDFVDGEVRGVYLSSRDRGLSWKTVLRPEGDLGPMAKCPWADYYLSVVPPAKKGGFLRCVRSKDGPTGKVDVKWTDTTSRSLAFFRPMQPLEKSRRWIVAGARGVDGVSRIALAISSDDGETWRDVVVTNAVSADHILYHDKSLRWNNGCCEPTIVELSNGDLLMAVRATFRHHYLYTSKDGGETWDGPKPAPMFCASNTMPTFLRLKDGRILFFWNNTEPLPKRDPAEYPELNKSELTGRYETVFTNRDALHAAISEDDGRTWIGFREVALNAIRNRPDFREYGNRKWREIDKSVHQTQPMELPDGKIILPYGQGASCRICLFDVSWLYETDRYEDFKCGLEGISHHLFVKSLAGNFRGWSGHCAFNRVPGALLVREPDTGPKTKREVLQLCRIRDERLVSDLQGVVWNFPAGLTGKLEVECRIDGEGFQLALCDHWFNPSDAFVGEEAALAVPVTAETLGGKGAWATLTLTWDWTAKTATLACGGRTQSFALRTDGKSPFGPSYMHLQTLARDTDAQGAYFRSFRKTAR